MTARHIQPLARPAPLIEPAPPMVLQHKRVLNCDVCGTWTAHSLTKSGTHYVCACGTMIEHLINAGPKLWAIR